MKNIILISIFLISFSVLNAQTFNVSVGLGGNVSQIDGDNLRGYRKFGKNGNFSILYNFENKFELMGNFAYHEFGSKKQFEKITTPSKSLIEMDMNAVQFGLGAKVFFKKSVVSNFKDAMFAGFAINQIFKQDYNYLTRSESYITEIPFNNRYLSIKAGIQFYINNHFSVTYNVEKSITSMIPGRVNDLIYIYPISMAVNLQYDIFEREIKRKNRRRK